jgi:hypothetical protein
LKISLMKMKMRKMYSSLRKLSHVRLNRKKIRKKINKIVKKKILDKKMSIMKIFRNKKKNQFSALKPVLNYNNPFPSHINHNSFHRQLHHLLHLQKHHMN